MLDLYYNYTIIFKTFTKIQGRIQAMWKLWFHKVNCLIYIKLGNMNRGK